MKMVFGGELRQQLAGMFWIAHHRVEINDAIKRPAGPDPFVYRLARFFLCFRVIAGNFNALTRGKCGADNFDSPGVCARNQLQVSYSDILSAARLGWYGTIWPYHFCPG